MSLTDTGCEGIRLLTALNHTVTDWLTGTNMSRIADGGTSALRQAGHGAEDLRPLAPLIGAGADAGVATDFRGVPRAATPSIGAFEPDPRPRARNG
jgi:hypothetical protein